MHSCVNEKGNCVSKNASLNSNLEKNNQDETAIIDRDAPFARSWGL